MLLFHQFVDQLLDCMLSVTKYREMWICGNCDWSCLFKGMSLRSACVSFRIAACDFRAATMRRSSCFAVLASLVVIRAKCSTASVSLSSMLIVMMCVCKKVFGSVSRGVGYVGAFLVG